MYRSSRTVLLGRLRYASAPRTTTRSLCAAASAASISAAAAIAARLHSGMLSDDSLGARSKTSQDRCSLVSVMLRHTRSSNGATQGRSFQQAV